MSVHTSAQVHPTAIIEDGAVVGKNCKIGPYVVIGHDVTLGDNVELKSHAVVDGWTEVGDETVIFPFASVGHIPQDLKYAGERTKLEIGIRNRIREGATLNPGTKGGGGLTKIGDNNLLMMHSHIGHDCIIGNGNVLANYVGLAGHVIAGNSIVFGANSGVHQWCRIGNGAMLAAYAAVVEDVIPYGTVAGNRATLDALNLVGLKRRGHSKDTINGLRSAFKDIFFSSHDNLRDRATAALNSYPGNQLVSDMVSFITADTNRRICTPKEI